MTYCFYFIRNHFLSSANDISCQPRTMPTKMNIYGVSIIAPDPPIICLHSRELYHWQKADEAIVLNHLVTQLWCNLVVSALASYLPN